MPHVRELIPVVVLNHQISRGHIGSIHRVGCKDIEREANAHGSIIHGPYDSVDLALAQYIDSEMEEMGYSDEDVKVHPCCRQRGAQRNEGGKKMAAKTTKKATTSKTTKAAREAGTPAMEKQLDEKVAPLFKNGKQVAAVRYGRKLLKKKAGMRSSTPPQTGLTNAEAAKVAKALGFVAKAPAKKVAEPLDS